MMKNKKKEIFASNELQDGSEPTPKGNHCDGEHSNGHDVSNDNIEGDTVLRIEVKPSIIIYTEFDSCDTISDFKTRRGEKQIFDRIGFINGNKDTRVAPESG